MVQTAFDTRLAEEYKQGEKADGLISEARRLRERAKNLLAEADKLIIEANKFWADQE